MSHQIASTPASAAGIETVAALRAMVASLEAQVVALYEEKERASLVESAHPSPSADCAGCAALRTTCEGMEAQLVALYAERESHAH